MYIVYGCGSEQFPRYNTFYEIKGVGPAPGVPPWDPWSKSLNAPHHKEQQYIWFMGGDLNSFRYIKHFVHFYEKSGWGMPPEDPGIHVT